MKKPWWIMLALVVVTVISPGPDLAADSSDKEARRRWALFKMDEMANEKLRCRVVFETKCGIALCEADYDRRFRHYNEIYIEASREE
jgi:hypothetical protein